MNLNTEHAHGIAVVRVGESRLMYPLLSDFSSAVTSLINSGERKLLIDLSAVGYVDSATIGCLMDLYRQAAAAGGTLKLAGVQKRVETMLTMTGAQNFIEVHPDEPSAVKSFGAETMRTIRTTTGATITLDGDLLAVLEVLYKEVTAKHALNRTFEDMSREIQHIIGQMKPDELKQYLAESLFLNTVSYENERLGAYMKKLTGKK
jgi:anti-anti-sigma factor